MAKRYLATDGDIREVLATMFASAEFWDRRNYGAKFKTPYEYVISSVRATGVPVRNFRPLSGTMQQLGMPLYGCQTPDGYANTQDAWLNPDAMMMRLSFATALGIGQLPLESRRSKKTRLAGEKRRELPVVAQDGGTSQYQVDPGPRRTEDDAARSDAAGGDARRHFSPRRATRSSRRRRNCARR